MGQTVLFFATLAFTILIGLKANINLGVVGIAMSFLLGQFCLQMSASEVILQFPTALFFVLFITTMFYGFANENGVLEGISLRLIQRFSHMEWTVPFLLFLSAATVSALGAGAMATPVIISPIAFSMAQRFAFITSSPPWEFGAELCWEIPCRGAPPTRAIWPVTKCFLTQIL